MALSAHFEKTLSSFQLRVDLEAGNETVALLGASGCGKSMTLKCIAGIERPDRGRIVLDGRTLFDSASGIDLPPQKRRTGLLFQSYALFPQMTVYANIYAGAHRQRDKAARAALVRKTMEDFGISEFSARYPHQLSGGQQQRVALARLLVSQPGILLLDEPFSALDHHLRFHMERELQALIRQFGKTVLFVSHDRDEVYHLSDTIALMENGSFTACGPKGQIFSAPVTVNGARLTGCKNISRLTLTSERAGIAVDWGIPLTFASPVPSESAYVGIRMHDVALEGDVNRFSCQVEEVIENPFSYTVMLRLQAGGKDGQSIGMDLSKDSPPPGVGDLLTVSLPPLSLLPLKA